jgi:hypothetical protein
MVLCIFSCAIESAGHFLICRFGSFLLLSKAQNVMRCGVSERIDGVTAFYQRYILLPTPPQYTFATMAMSFVVGDRRTQQENLHLAAEYYRTSIICWVHVHGVYFASLWTHCGALFWHRPPEYRIWANVSQT